MVLLVSILLVVLYVKVLSCITSYCLLSLYYDISHASFHCVILAEPCNLFFLFASFQVQVKKMMRRVLAWHSLLGLDVYRAHLNKRFSGRLLAGWSYHANGSIFLFGVSCIPLWG